MSVDPKNMVAITTFRKSYHNITGSRFSRLVAVEPAGKTIRSSGVVWLCKCDCGNTALVEKSMLSKGKTRSCGCLNTEARRLVIKNTRNHKNTHGMTHSRVYYTWRNMINRCSSPKNSHYIHYGGRGIKVCKRWLSFKNFLADMGEPGTGMSIDRIDNDGNYEPGNCRWATSTQQAWNQRKSPKSKSPYKGVNKLPSGMWRARIKSPGDKDKRHIGVFKTAKEAAMAYDREALAERGSFAVLNFPVGRKR